MTVCALRCLFARVCMCACMCVRVRVRVRARTHVCVCRPMRVFEIVRTCARVVMIRRVHRYFDASTFYVCSNKIVFFVSYAALKLLCRKYIGVMGICFLLVVHEQL